MANITTIKEHLSWSYANLAAAHNAIEAGTNKYKTLQYMIRARLYKGLTSDNMKVGSLYDDEKIKYEYPRSCCYCGSIEKLTLDHLIPRNKGGLDHGDNLVWACKSCNSSKRDTDVLEWLNIKNINPSILLLRRYLKLIFIYCTENNILDIELTETDKLNLPFNINLLPYKIENLQDRVLWVEPIHK